MINDPMEYMVQDLLKDENIETLLDALFISDEYVDFDKLLNLLESRAGTYKKNLSADEKECIDDMLKGISSSRKLQILLLFTIKDALKPEVRPDTLAKLDYTMFWSMFPIAIKKCLNSPTAVVNRDDYYTFVKTLSVRELSLAQVTAHDTCITNFNYDANKFPNNLEQLAIFLHPMRSFKKTRTKKKHISRVLKKANKIMIAHKILHRESQDIVFKGRTYKIPEQFAKAISNNFLSEK